MFELAPEQVEELNEKKEEDRKYITTIAISAASSLASHTILYLYYKTLL